MRREEKYDMFDVASGNCDLGEYLMQRYCETDLTSTYWLEPSDRLLETRKPTPQAEPMVVERTAETEKQLQAAIARARGEEPEEEGALDEVESAPPSLEELVQRFQSAAKEYSERQSVEPEDHSEHE